MKNQLGKSNVVILAGGKGTRLSERSGDLPKPMVPLFGKPVLQHQIELCKKYGFVDIVILIQYQHEKISNYFGDGSEIGVSIKYVVENAPRGTAGALRDALSMFTDRFLVLYGDTFADVDLKTFWNAHIKAGVSGTLLLHPNDHPQDSDLVDIANDGIIKEIRPYPHPPNIQVRNLVNAAMYVLEKANLEYLISAEKKEDIAKHLFPRMISLGYRLKGYITSEYIKDMGTPERLDKVERDFAEGLPERLSKRHLRSAIFLDRDGTLIEEVNHLTSPNDLKLLTGVAAAVRLINRVGKLAIVITNQPVVARGEITFEGLSKVHARLETELGKEGAYLDGLYVCPHHPDRGFPGEILELKKQCDCRKPETGLIDKACNDHQIDRSSSWMIGDTTSDIETGRRSGLRTVLLRTGYAGSDDKYQVRPDYIFPNLNDAVEWILFKRSDLTRRLMPIALKISCKKTRLVLIGGLARSGKSFSAQVLKENLHQLGEKAHIVSLDGWLKPKEQRKEGAGVCTRYDLKEATQKIMEIVVSNNRKLLNESLYDRDSGNLHVMSIQHSVGIDDIIIVEGVPSLLINEFDILSNTVKIFIEINEIKRKERLINDYAWRTRTIEQFEEEQRHRSLDETPMVIKSRLKADYIIKQ